MTFRLAIAAAALASLASAAPAGAAGITLEPSRLEATVHRGGRTPAIAITNHTARRVAVVAQPYPAREALTGLPEYQDTAAGRAAGDRLLALSAHSFTLAPGASRRVRAKVLACPQDGLGTYGVIEFSLRDAAAPRAGIASRLRLTAPLLLTYPPRPCYAAAVTGVRAEQAGRRRLTFFADVRNLGNLHFKAVTTLRILRAGKPVFAGRFATENVLPHAVREFALPLRGRLAAGTYTAEATTVAGGRRTSRRATLHLTRVNTLPTPRLRLTGLRVDGAHPGSSPTVNGTVASRGTERARGSIRVLLTRAGLGTPSDTRTVAVAPLAPRAAREFRVSLPPLNRGRWAVTALVRTGTRQTDTRTVSFTVGAAPAAAGRWRDWAAKHLDAILAAAGGLALLPLIMLVIALLRRRGSGGGPSAAELAEIRAALSRMEAVAAGRGLGADASAQAGVAPADAPGFVAGTTPVEDPQVTRPRPGARRAGG